MAYPAPFYAALHRGTPGDLEFYQRQALGAPAVLELGCGFGRVLAALRAPGRRLVGIDRDEDLLQLARTSLGCEPELTLIRDDIRTVSLAQRFDRVFIPHSTIYCMQTDAEVLACLRRARGHLRPGGLLALDAYVADAFHADDDDDIAPQSPATFVTTVSVQGRLWDVYETSEWVRAEQRIVVTYRYCAQEDDEVVTGTIAHHYMLREQLLGTLAQAGFSEICLAGGFEDEALDEDSEYLTVTARG